MTVAGVRFTSQAGLDAEAARQLATAATTALAISQVQSAYDSYRQALTEADDQRGRAVATAAHSLAHAVRAALDTYEAGLTMLTAPTDEDEDGD